MKNNFVNRLSRLQNNLRVSLSFGLTHLEEIRNLMMTELYYFFIIIFFLIFFSFDISFKFNDNLLTFFFLK